MISFNLTIESRREKMLGHLMRHGLKKTEGKVEDQKMLYLFLLLKLSHVCKYNLFKKSRPV